MISKNHNHKSQTTLWHREEEPLNHHETPGRQIKQSNQLSNFLRKNIIILSLCMQRCYGRHNVSRKSVTH